MSTGADDASIVQQIRMHTVLQLLALTFFYYDHLLTFDQEISFIWKRMKTPSSYWFLLNRYVAFLGNIVVGVFIYLSMNVESCEHSLMFKKFNLFRQLLLVVNAFLSCSLLTMRIYALYCRDRRVLWCLGVFMAVLLGLTCWSLTGQKNHATASLGCHFAMPRQTAIYVAIPWESLFAFDTVIIMMTIAKTYRGRYRNVSIGSLPLVSLVVRDGAMYFAAMAGSSLANILTFMYAGPFLRGSLSTFASCLSVTMMSRLMLNLHRKTDVGIHTTNYAGVTSAAAGRSGAPHAQFTSYFTSTELDIASMHEFDDECGSTVDNSHDDDRIRGRERFELDDVASSSKGH